MDENEHSSADLGRKSCSEMRQGMLFSSGKNLLISASTNEPDGLETGLTVLSSGTNRQILAADSFERRTRLLIAAGLIAGITPTSVRRTCGAVIPDFVSSWQGGDDVGEQKADC